jgi:hypothetical protein
MEVKQFARLLLNVIENQAAKTKGGYHEITTQSFILTIGQRS